MKTIEVDDQIYHYIASRTLHIGESASDILRRLLALPQDNALGAVTVSDQHTTEQETPVSEGDLVTLLNNAQLAKEESAIARFMLILSTLYQANPEAFTQATEIKGRKRVYFARTEEELLAAGNTTKPKSVPGTPYWVISNTNTGRKRNIVAQVMTTMGYPAEFSAQVCEKI